MEKGALLKEEVSVSLPRYVLVLASNAVSLFQNHFTHINRLILSYFAKSTSSAAAAIKLPVRHDE